MGFGNKKQPSIQITGGADTTAIEQELSTINTKLTASVEREQKNVDYALKKNARSLSPLITFEDDDGKSETHTKIFNLFQAKGEKFVAAISSGKIGLTGYMPQSQIDEIFNAGHEIASHGVTHNWATTHPEETKQSYDELNEMGYKTENMVYVGGAFDNGTILDVKKYYNSSTAVGGGVNVAPIRTFALKRVSLGSFYNGEVSYNGIAQDGSYESYKAMVDYAIANNAWLIFMMHSWDVEHNATQQQHLSDLIDYIKTTNARIVTRKEGLQSYGNTIDIGDVNTDHFLVGADGSVSNPRVINKLAYKNQGLNPNVTTSSIETSFEKGYVNVASFTSGSGSGFPSSNAGTLETYYLNDKYTLYQKWYPYNQDEIWHRRYNTTSNSWHVFKKIAFDPLPATTTINVPSQTVSANSVLEVRLDHPDPTNINGLNDIVVMSPVGGLETHLMYSVSMWTSKKIILRLHNPTGSAITTAAKDWRVKVLK